MMYTVKQLSDMAGVSVRTLHYYDEIELVKPSSVGDNGYRYYGEEAVLRLQQVLFFRELDFNLNEIKAIIDQPEFDVLNALQAHGQALRDRANRLSCLIQTVDKTILHLKGKINMSTEEIFAGFSSEKQAAYEQEARERWGEDMVSASVKRWNSYSKEQKARIFAEAGEIYRDLVAHMDKGHDSPDVQAVIGRWHQNLRHFYEPTPQIMAGLADAYNEHPDFVALYRKMHPDLPAFLREAIHTYCQTLAR